MSDNKEVINSVRLLINMKKEDNLSIQSIIQENYNTDTKVKRRTFDKYRFDNKDIFCTNLKAVIYDKINSVIEFVFAREETNCRKIYPNKIIPIVIEYIFSTMNVIDRRKLPLRLSYSKIYNEKEMNTSLNKSERNIRICEEFADEAVVKYKNETIYNTEQCMSTMNLCKQIIKIIESYRIYHNTETQTIFQIIIEYQETNANLNDVIQILPLNLVVFPVSKRTSQIVTTERYFKRLYVNLYLPILQLAIKELNKNQVMNFQNNILIRFLQAMFLGKDINTRITCNIFESMIMKNNEIYYNRTKKVVKQKALHENKLFLYNSESICEDQMENIMKKNQFLIAENIRLFNCLIEKVKEIDILRDKCEMLKNELKMFTEKTKLECDNSKELNKNYKQIKLQEKIINYKLEDFKMKFQRKYANAEILRMKANENINVSVCDTLLDTSNLSDKMDVVHLEEKVMLLNDKLQMLNNNHIVFTNIFEKKRVEFEKLFDNRVSEKIGTPQNIFIPGKHQQKYYRIEKLYKCIVQVQEDLLQFKNDLSSIGCDLDKFKNEKTIFVDKINKLKSINAGLLHKISDTEELLHTADKKSTDSNNININLITELNELKNNYNKLKYENSKLIRNLKRSSKLETELETLRDLNIKLQNNFEGASNCVVQLQENKNQLLKDLINCKIQNVLFLQKNVELKKLLLVNKTILNNPNFKVKEYLEKEESIMFKFEEKKLLNSIEKNSGICMYEVKDLNEKIEKLDREIEVLIKENERLVANVYSYCTDSFLGTLKSEMKNPLKENTIYQSTLIECNILNRESAESYKKVEDSQSAVGLRNNNANCNKNEVSNETRELKRIVEYNRDNNISADNIKILRQKVQDLQLELILKTEKIEVLESRVESKYMPYQRKCRDLEESLLACSNKNIQLKRQLKKFRKDVNVSNITEYNVCKQNIGGRNQCSQTLNDKIFCCDTSSSITDENIKIQKLEKEKCFMRELLRDRCKRIKELESRIEELETINCPSVLCSNETFTR